MGAHDDWTIEELSHPGVFISCLLDSCISSFFLFSIHFSLPGSYLSCDHYILDTKYSRSYNYYIMAGNDAMASRSRPTWPLRPGSGEHFLWWFSFWPALENDRERRNGLKVTVMSCTAIFFSDQDQHLSKLVTMSLLYAKMSAIYSILIFQKGKKFYRALFEKNAFLCHFWLFWGQNGPKLWPFLAQK